MCIILMMEDLSVNFIFIRFIEGIEKSCALCEKLLVSFFNFVPFY